MTASTAWHYDSPLVNWLIENTQTAYSSAIIDVETLALYAGAPLAAFASVTAFRAHLANVYAAYVSEWGQALELAFNWNEIDEIPYNESGLVCI